ncbi:serine/threonine protein kinase [Actinosynnema mirum DSM 43827]|uniref:non-specific serine/threonine protein kinase n=1 Tax=Actinosynnema mirum (strain ATCC 29888 / DSM 43827 / JCM 3225 / NBRC 14064 / NCIMB 13271 / NRRL B-12336 / IMRU 3971 / 101) TaxID=446462 RepID=C6WNJ7_ACTMD|nr:serine/threonine protein kinase [Actinosynnema mirum DSM 43827]
MRIRKVAERYELIEEISSGGMGTVWRGYDAVLDREVAVKLIRADAVSSKAQAEEFAKRFRREARVTARIGHHGVPQVHDAVLDHTYDRLYLVMEYVRGTSLRTLLTPKRPLPISWAAAIAAQIATVLSHAHAIPVVHRDLKPDNVLIAAGGTVKVLDFGIATILRTDATRLTATGNPIGTSCYMSPEQIMCAQITPHSDLYALGCVLHELLSGKPVFDGDGDYALMHQHVNASPQPLRAARSDVPPDLELLTLDLLAKSSKHRPANAYEVYERLLAFLPLPGSAPPSVDDAAIPIGAPDPTLLYRRPNAPLQRSAKPSAAVEDDVPVALSSHVDTRLCEVIRVAYDKSAQLLDEERYTQAADVLQRAIAQSAAALGKKSPRILKMRTRRAAILIVGGDYQRALPEFDSLTDAYSRTLGSTSPEALECLQEAAHCRAELGQATAALRQFQQVLTHVRAAGGDASPTALDLRRSIGVLLLSEGKTLEAVSFLQPLYDDLLLVQGPQDEETEEVGNILARLHFTED